jgi:hypothetical protein
MSMDASVDFLLSRLEMEYRMVVAATRPPAQAEASLLEDEEAQADAEAQGYATIGFDNEDDEEGEVVDAEGYACMGDEAEESDDDGMPRAAASDDDADKENTFDASGVPAVLETTARSATGAAPVIDLVAASPIAIVVRLIFGSVTATAWASAKTGEEPAAADAEPWVVEFPPLAEAPAAAAPLPPGRADAIRHVMAGLTLAPPPPGWAKAVPEAVWKHRLLSAAQRRAAYGHDGL